MTYSQTTALLLEGAKRKALLLALKLRLLGVSDGEIYPMWKLYPLWRLEASETTATPEVEFDLRFELGLSEKKKGWV